MDGRNSTGSKVSLLNDSSDVAPLATKAHHQLPSLAAAHYSHQHHHPHTQQKHHSHYQHHHHSSRQHSRASSRTSTPSLSPQTPPLVRSDSSDSRTFGSPSPLTPAHHHSSHDRQQHDRQQQYFIVQHRYGKMDDPAMSMYPPPDASNLAMPSAYALPAQLPVQVAPPVQQPMQNMQPMQQQYRSSASPSSEPSRVSTVSAASNGARPVAPKKNQYPCPLSKQFNCADYFTTSGHAARHAKKHTGKKDAFCPECNKAFTRKDNMEQHRRTHQNGRGASRSSDDSKIKKPATKPAPKKSIKAEPAFEAAVEQQLAEQQLEQQQSQPQMPMAQAQMQPQTLQQAQSQHPNTDPAILIPPVGGPYYLNNADSGPIHSLPMPSVNEGSGRPPLQRNVYGATSLDYFPPPAQMMGELDSLNFSYPSPGLSNGLNSLALAASEHRRMAEEKSSKSPSSDGHSP
jgi:hypothetical protein